MSEQEVVYEIRAKLRCATCHGEGSLNESSDPCPACKGQGRVYRMVTLQEAMAAVLIPPVRL